MICPVCLKAMPSGRTSPLLLKAHSQSATGILTWASKKTDVTTSAEAGVVFFCQNSCLTSRGFLHNKRMTNKNIPSRRQPHYRQRPPADGYLAVNEIVNTVFCEQQAVFIWQYGKKTTAQQQRRLERGIIEHKRFEAAGRTLQKQETDRRCFIASYVFGGNAPETSFLRQWRDNQLLLYWFGPSLVRLYYLLSPTLVKCFSFIPYSRPVLAFIIKRLFIGQIRRGL